jgi:2-hydroxychromene-2-carboxylate isomerase
MPRVSIVRRISPILMSALTSPRTRAVRRSAAEFARRARGRPREVHYFHQVDDPYSHLAAQLLEELPRRYDVALVPHLVAPPAAAAAPERALLEAFARRDAADVAPGYALAFPRDAAAPKLDAIQRAQRVLARAIARGVFADFAAPVGNALWSGDTPAIAAIADLVGEASDTETRDAVSAGTKRRERLGHYLGAMFYYAGEWYWGVDRLHHLERRLAVEGAALAGTLVRRPSFTRSEPRGASASPAHSDVVLEYFASLRSPYTYIATERVFALVDHYGVQLVLRPVLPMVMRGLPVPPTKQLYIALDTKREAEDAGVAFGNICDPVGRPVERAFSLYPWARERGRDRALLLEFMRACWSEGVDTGRDAGLRRVVERAGLPWRDAQTHLDRDGWRDELEANRAALFALGLWGVPSFCVRGGASPPYATWGQDRLWRVEQEIAARLSVAAR